MLGLPRKELLKGLLVVGIALQKNEIKSFPGRRKEEIRTVKNVVLCLFFQNVLLV